MNRKLENKVAIVSGSGRGIGREIALKLASEGARVVINDLDAEPAAQTVAEIVAAGGSAIACAGSVTDSGFADRFVGTAVETYGGLDIIVNNAGYTWDNVVQKMSDEQWEAMLAVHLTAPFRILRAASNFIRDAAKREADEGLEVFRKVVNISSTSGVYGNAGQANYAAAKAGVTGLTKTLAKEWGQFKINCNAIAFGFVETRLTAAKEESGEIERGGEKIELGIPEQMREMGKMMIPLGRPATPEEAAGPVLMLCSEYGNYIHGQVINVTGGQFTGMYT
jgi:3-oxoacyl-[acyl-carrier protein] reductase